MARRRICGIYKIVSPTGRVYIGQSINILKRFATYRHLSKTNNGVVRLYYSLKKHGALNHDYSIIEECSVEVLNERERCWQDHYDVLGKMGLNCRLTGLNDKTGIISDETRLKMSISGKNKIMTDEHMERIRASHKRRIGTKGRKRTPEEKQRNREISLSLGLFQGEKNPMYGSARFGEKNPFFGKTHSEEAILKMSEKAKNRKFSKETRKKFSDMHSLGGNWAAKLVLNLETGIYYECGKEAWMSTSKYTYSTFKSKLNGSNKHPLSFRYV